MRRLVLCVLMELAYILGVIYFIVRGEYGNIGLIGFCMAFTIIMYYLVSRNVKPVDDGIYVTLSGFVFMASFLGSGFRFYDIIPHYDDFLHLWSGIICTQMGFVIFRHLWEIKEDISKKKLLLILLFVLFFSMGCAAIWEIFEFASDVFTGTNMQAGGLEDTCIDMIDAFIGCVLTLPYIKHLVNKITIDE